MATRAVNESERSRRRLYSSVVIFMLSNATIASQDEHCALAFSDFLIRRANVDLRKQPDKLKTARVRELLGTQEFQQ